MSLQSESAASTPLAIIGIGCLFPRAQGAQAFWLNIKNGVDCIGPVPPSHWNPDDYLDADPKSPDRTYAARGGFLEPVDFRPLDFGIAPNDLEATDTSQLLGLVAARQALNDAGYGPDRDFDRNRVSVIIGVTGTLELVIPLGARLGHPRWKKALKKAGVPDAQAQQVVDDIADSYVGWQENSFPGLLGNVVAGRIANRLDLGGTNCVVDAACASSLSALHLAGLELASGRCDVAVTGGVDTFNDIFMFMCFSKTPALSPTGDARPFDAAGDGTILGEGLGIVVIKRLADAERDGDRVYAVIRGLGSSSDGKGNAIYAPSSAGQMKALRNAYRLADVAPETIELIEAHGTGTRVGDAAEASALRDVYREAQPAGTWCAIGSIKSQIGHTKAAAGAAGLIKAALALHHQVLPPTIKVSEPLEQLKSGQSPFYVNTERRPWVASPNHPRRAGVSAFGFGGSNFHCVLEEHPSNRSVIDWGDDVEIVALSAANPADLGRELDRWQESKTWPILQREAAASRVQFSSKAAHRLILVVSRDAQNSAKLIEACRAKLKAEPQARFWRLPEGAYYGAGPVSGRLAVLFPGQGSQYVGMLRDLACQFPAMRDILAEANRVFQRLTGDDKADRLSDRIYPIPGFRAEEREEKERSLRATEVAQPAIGAVSLGALKILEGFGVKPEAFAGHSYGELPALCAAGCFDDEALHTMSRLRGHLMASYHGGDAGCMLAVHAPLLSIEAMLREESLELVVANRNAPTQTVLSGRGSEIDRAVTCLNRRQLRHTRLPVAAAFHSPLVASAKGPFREALGELEFHTATHPVFANTSGREYPEAPAAIREQLAEQLAKPVDFVQEITCMAEGGIRTFLEVGPGSTLTKLVSSILGTPEVADRFAGWDAFAIDASQGKRSGTLDLAHALARLAAHGHEVDLSPWQNRGTAPVQPIESSKPGLIVPIGGANYVSPKAGKTREIEKAPKISPPQAPTARKTPPPVPVAVTRTKTMLEPTATRVAPPASANGTATVHGDSLSQALGVTQQSLAAFQKLQEQTAQLHRQFLENQEAAQRTLQMLVEQQHSLLLGGARPIAPAPVMPVREAKPAPVHQNGNGHAPVEVRRTAPPPARVVPEPVRVAPAPPRFDPTAVLLEVVAEKTGYPADMLTPEMALDADLGIDSIKRVEIFSALQDRLPAAPVVKPEHLGSLHTLRDVITFLSNGSAAPVVESRPTPAPVPAKQPAKNADVSAILLAVVAEKTGYPADMLNAEMALDADLGIDSIKRVEIFSALQDRLPDAPVVKPEHLGSLHTLGDVIGFLSSGPSAAPPADTAAKKKSLTAEASPDPTVIERSVLRTVAKSPDAGVKKIQLAAGSLVVIVADETPLSAMLIDAIEDAGCRAQLVSWKDPAEVIDASQVSGLILHAPILDLVDDLPLRGFRWIRHLAVSLKQFGERGGAFLASITQLDGAFGIENLDAATDARQGSLAGLIKTAAHEWPTVACKAIDLEKTLPLSRLRTVWDELIQRGPIEIGITTHETRILQLNTEASVTGASSLTSSDVILVTGGARGVTAAISQALAEHCQPTLVLLGRTEVEAAEPAWLQNCESESAIKQAIARHQTPTPTPRIIEAEYRRVLAVREMSANIARMREAGANVIYFALDITEPDAVHAALSEIRTTTGPITALIHGAGVLADRRIEDLTDEQFEQVYATKVTGLETLLNELASDPLTAIVLFSSSTGRFGRIGQVAYAAANEALNKIAQQQARARPDCKVRAINWGPWDGGMVTPVLRKMFATEGVGVIPLREGAQIVLNELASPSTDVEVTVIARPAGNAVPAVALQVVFERDVSLTDHPFLRSHVIDSRAVLPLAMHMEWLAHAALHGNPGLLFHGLDDLRLLNGVQLDIDQSTRLKAHAGKPVRNGDGFRIPVELRSTRGSREIVHSRAEVVLVSRLPVAAKAGPAAALKPYPHSTAEIYQDYLFHGPDLMAIQSVTGVAESAIAGTCRSSPAPAEWMAHPSRHAWITDPLAVDAAFQFMILWSFAENGSGCLPCFVGRYRQYRKSFPVGPLSERVRITKRTGSLARADIDVLDSSGEVIATLHDHESVIDEKLNDAFRRNRLDEPVAADGGTNR